MERTSRTISVACVASAAVHALLYFALSVYGQRPLENAPSSAEVQLVLSPSDTPPESSNKDASLKPEPPKPEAPKPEVRPPHTVPPPPPPPKNPEPERVRLGNQNSPETETRTWLGSDKPEQSQARKSSVEQGAFTKSPGMPGETSDTMAPASPTEVAPSPPSKDEAQTPSVSPTDNPPSEPAAPPPAALGATAPLTPPAQPFTPDAAADKSDSTTTAATITTASPAVEQVASSIPKSPPPTPPPAAAPPVEDGGLLPPERAAPSITPRPDLASHLNSSEQPSRTEANLEDLFPRAELVPSAEKPPKPTLTRERAIALLREALTSPLIPRPVGATMADAPPFTKRPPSTSEQPSGGGSAGDRPFEKSDRDVDPSSLEDPIDVKPGQPLAAKGLEIKTSRLDLTTLSRQFSYTTNPVVRVKFGRNGLVLHADFVKGQTAGSPEWNNALLSAMYRWVAAGEELKKLPKGDPEAGVEVQFRILLRD